LEGEVKSANYAPVYLALYPKLADLVRSHGYALAVHGTMGRDFDLIAVPWVTVPSEPERVVEALMSTFRLKPVGWFTWKEHHRRVLTLSIAHGECFLDLSFTPSLSGREALGA